MDQVKTIYKISQILSNAFKEVNDVCAHYLVDQSIELEQPRHFEKKAVQQKSKERSAPVQESQPKKQKQVNIPEKIQQQRSPIVEPVQQKKQKTQSKQQTNGHKDKTTHPEKPKQPLSPYFIFQQQQKENVKKLHPTSAVTDLAKMMGEIWRGLQQSERAPYYAKTEKLKAQYEKELKKFYDKHPEQKSKKQLKREKAQSKSQQEVVEAPVTKTPAKQSSKQSRKPVVIEEQNSESV